MRIFFLFAFVLACVPLRRELRLTPFGKTRHWGGIAGKYGVSTAALQAVNGISNPNLLFVGKKLKIPPSTIRQIEYTIKKGDSLGGIASRFGVKSSDLIKLNQIKQPDLIKVGQKIKIPLGKRLPAKSVPSLSSTVLKALAGVKNSSRWKRIVIHHSATPVDDALNMHQVHLKQRRMKNGLAYHFVISNGSRKASDGEIYIGDRWKKQIDGGHMKQSSLNKPALASA